MSTRTLSAATLIALAATLPFAGTARAAETSPFTANVGLVSDYAYRGWSQTDEKPALQGGFDYAHDSGLYAGVWGSSVSWLADADPAISNGLELDLYAGYKGKVGDIGYDVGLLQYYYPGSYPTGFNSPDTLEGYAAVSWEFLTLKYSYSFTDLFGFDNSDGSQYLDLSASYEIADGLKLNAHVGRQYIAGPAESYNDWKIGVSKSLAGFDIGLHYVDTDVDSKLSDGRVILSIGRAF